MNPKPDLSTAKGLDALPDTSLILTRGGIVLQKWNHFHRTGVHAWHRPGYVNDYSTDDLLEKSHQPITFIAAVNP